MLKAIITAIITVIIGWIFSAVGLELLNGFTELGIIVSVAFMGGAIIYFNEKKK